MKKKSILVLLSLIIGLGVGIFMVNTRNHANEVEFSIEVEEASVYKEDTFTLQVKVNSNVPIGKMEAYITYDSDIIEFVSCDSESIKGGAGTLHLLEKAGQGAKSLEYTITMKALELGDGNFKVSDVVIEDYNTGESISIKETKSSCATIQVNMNEEISGEARLQELLIFPGELTPGFSPDIYEYSVDVTSDITELIITALPMDEESSVKITKDEKLSFGENEILITVTAPSGQSKDYMLKVNREK